VNRILKAYLAAGMAFLLAVYVIMLSLWFESSLSGSVTGQYVVGIDTNAFGESYAVLALFFLFLPVVAWFFTRGLRRLLTSGEVI
jgi:hypothetical protein